MIILKALTAIFFSFLITSCASHMTDEEFISKQPPSDRKLVAAGMSADKKFTACAKLYINNEIALKNNCAKFIENSSFLGEFISLNKALLAGYNMLLFSKRAGFFQCYLRDQNAIDLAGSLKAKDTLIFKGSYSGVTWAKPSKLSEQPAISTIILKDCTLAIHN